MSGAQAPPLLARPSASGHAALLVYRQADFMHAKAFVFRKWGELALERRIAPPEDLSGACKYGSLFVRAVFGGVIEGHYAHQFNRVNGRLIDLSHDALDVGGMRHPYQHDAAYFEIPEYRARLAGCLPRVGLWAAEFRREAAGREEVE